MLKRRLFYLLFIGFILISFMPHAYADDVYSWQVNYQHVILDIDDQGYVDMQYEIDASIVEGVWEEVWIPMTKSDMKVSKVIDGNGDEHRFDIDDGQIKIQGFDLSPGDHVNLKIYSTLYEFVYTASTPDYVIVTFTPDWWDMNIEDTQVKYYLPGLVNDNEIKTGRQEYSNVMVEDGRTAVYFEAKDMYPNQQFETSVSFPDSVMDQSILVTPTNKPVATTGVVYGQTTESNPLCGCLCCLSMIIVFAGPLLYFASRRKPYAPPVVSMDGVGVNKDLDPVEAATLLRIDPRRVLTMIMFGMMRKGNVKLISTDPVRLERVSSIGNNYYEGLFYDAIVGDRLDEDRLLNCFKVLARSVVDKTRPYCRKDTEEYYKKKIEDSWGEIKAVDTPELKLEKYDSNMIWLMADDQFDKKTQDYVTRVPGSDTFTVPSYYWWYAYYYGMPHHHYHDRYHDHDHDRDHGYHGPAPSPMPSGSLPSGSPMSNGGVPVGGKAPESGVTASMESFAGSISDSVEAFSTGVVGGVEKFVGVRNEANAPPPAAPRHSPASRPAPGPATFRGRSSCDCVSCACACVSCACACAGGGGGRGCT